MEDSLQRRLVPRAGRTSQQFGGGSAEMNCATGPGGKLVLGGFLGYSGHYAWNAENPDKKEYVNGITVSWFANATWM